MNFRTKHEVFSLSNLYDFLIVPLKKFLEAQFSEEISGTLPEGLWAGISNIFMEDFLKEPFEKNLKESKKKSPDGEIFEKI